MLNRGQQALSEAQRYPQDLDGIVAGDLRNDRILLNADFVESWRTTHPANGPSFPASKRAMLSKAVLAACDNRMGWQTESSATQESARLIPTHYFASQARTRHRASQTQKPAWSKPCMTAHCAKQTESGCFQAGRVEVKLDEVHISSRRQSRCVLNLDRLGVRRGQL
ncbi:MAG: hypothetical protein HIU93_07775 [Acidobacteria bacterium]|nr:hypothetical protein [Acidobacteriota bacterium]